MNVSAQKTKRLPYLDGIKTFALLMVFALHTQRGSEVTAPCHDAVLFYAARCCMPLFFMVNGSLMLRRETFDFSYYKRKILGIARVLLLNGICIGVYVFVVHQFPIAKAVKLCAGCVGRSLLGCYACIAAFHCAGRILCTGAGHTAASALDMAVLFLSGL